MPEPGPLLLDDDALLAQCTFETLRASGPGGQHRNKTESGVRLRHLPTGVVAQAYERRSQHRNREVALARLRRALATEVRSPVDVGRFEISDVLAAILPAARPRLGPAHPRFWAGAKDLLDLFVALGCSVADTAAVLGLSTGATSRLLLADPDLVAAVNRYRAVRGLHPLR